MPTPEQVVQAQLDAYNARDLEALMRTYHPEAEQFSLHGERLAKGHAEIRARFVVRLAEPDLHARLLQRTVMGRFVVDHERVTRNLPEGRGQVELLCVYEVDGGAIVRASFAPGVMQLESDHATGA